MVRLKWILLKEYYFGRRKNRVGEEYYSKKYKDISAYFSKKPITYETIRGFFTWLDLKFEVDNGKRMSNSYRNKYLSVLKVCARLTGTNIDEYKGDNENEDRCETEKLTTEEYDRLCATWIDYGYDTEYRNFFDILYIKVSVITTQRPGNIRDLKWIDYNNGYLHFRMTKNGTPHRVYLPLHIQEDVAKLKKYGPYIFATEERKSCMQSMNKMVQNRCELAGIAKKITLKSFRRTGITEYLKTNQLQKVMKISNHKDPRVVINHYYDPENKEIEEIVDNNPFAPIAMTTDKILDECSRFENELNKRGVQANKVVQNNNVVITVPLNT